jgi:hypothetical protein
MVRVKIFTAIPLLPGGKWKPFNLLTLNGIPQEIITPQKVKGTAGKKYTISGCYLYIY